MNESTPGDRTLELAQRLMAFIPHGPTVRVFVGALPPEWPEDIPLPEGADLVGSNLMAAGSRADRVQAVLDASGAVDAVLGAYQDHLLATGWTPYSMRGHGGGGFAPAAEGQGFQVRRSQDPLMLRAAAAAMASGTLDLRVSLDWQLVDPQGPLGHHRGSHLPVLVAPLGVTVEPLGGGGSDDAWHEQAVAKTDIGCAALAREYARQLESAGWSHRAGGEDETACWSTWGMPGDGEWSGALFVLAQGANSNRLWLWLGAQSDKASGGSYSSVMSALKGPSLHRP
ncbi:MAG: hypothetical protein ACREN7_07605 [Candidatus Dormibacteria bacterium]